MDDICDSPGYHFRRPAPSVQLIYGSRDDFTVQYLYVDPDRCSKLLHLHISLWRLRYSTSLKSHYRLSVFDTSTGISFFELIHLSANSHHSVQGPM